MLNLKTRKRIWEVDCISMDAALAASFEWKDLANLLQGFGVTIPRKGEDAPVSMHIHNLMHRYCHSENDISLAVERILNLLHQHTLEQIAHFDAQEVMGYATSFHLSHSKRMGSIFWALGTDARKEFDCIRRRFHQRFQILALRDLMALSAQKHAA